MRNTLRLVLTVLVLSAVLCGPALAADTEGSHGGGQPNIFEWALDLAIWTFVVFILLVFVLSKFAWKPMLEGLRQREVNIRQALDEARQARKEAEQLHAELTAERNQAAQKIRDMMDEARRDAEQLKVEMVSLARAEIQAERDRLRREIETAKDQALAEIWKKAIDLAAMISTKAVRKQITADDHRSLIDEALAELPQVGVERAKFLSGDRA